MESKLLLRLSRLWGRVTFAPLKERLYFEKKFKSQKVYNYITLGEC